MQCLEFYGIMLTFFTEICIRGLIVVADSGIRLSFSIMHAVQCTGATVNLRQWVGCRILVAGVGTEVQFCDGPLHPTNYSMQLAAHCNRTVLCDKFEHGHIQSVPMQFNRCFLK